MPRRRRFVEPQSPFRKPPRSRSRRGRGTAPLSDVPSAAIGRRSGRSSSSAIAPREVVDVGAVAIANHRAPVLRGGADETFAEEAAPRGRDGYRQNRRKSAALHADSEIVIFHQRHLFEAADFEKGLATDELRLIAPGTFGEPRAQVDRCGGEGKSARRLDEADSESAKVRVLQRVFNGGRGIGRKA